MMEKLLHAATLIPVFLFALCVHEFAHAWVADLRGDQTAREAGRLSLHPLAHADLVGTFLLPLFCLFAGWPFFGWARPVPVQMDKLKRGRVDMALVAAAGPGANMGLAILSTLALAALLRFAPPEGFERIWDTLRTFSVVSIQVNLLLGFFNLLPLPPLDGFNVLHGILPNVLARQLLRLQPYGNVALLFLLFLGGFQLIGLPVEWAFQRLLFYAARG